MLVLGMVGVFAVLIVFDVEIAAVSREALELNVIGDLLKKFEQFSRESIVAEDLVFVRLIGTLVEKADFEVLPFVVGFIEEKNLFVGLRSANEWRMFGRAPSDRSHLLTFGSATILHE